MLNRPIHDLSKDPLQDEYDHVDSEFGPFASEGICGSVKQNSLSSLTHTISERVKTPMTLQQLADYVSSNEYCAELALQHALLLLIKQSEDITEARREAIRWHYACVENSPLEEMKTTLFPWNKYWNKGKFNLSNCLHCGEFREHGHKCKI